MQIVEPSVTVFHYTPQPERTIERAARTCYQSIHLTKKCGCCGGMGKRKDTSILSDSWAFDVICNECEGTGTDISSARTIIKGCIKNGHESVVEHSSVGVIIVTDRGVTHELVRHRIGVAFSQESTRYVLSSNEEEGTIRDFYVIEPPMTVDQRAVWEDAMLYLEGAYKRMISLGAKPQIARSVLPNSLKAEICVTMSFRAWRHFLQLRDHNAAHPQMRQIAQMVKKELVKIAPSCFEDLVIE